MDVKGTDAAGVTGSSNSSSTSGARAIKPDQYTSYGLIDDNNWSEERKKLEPPNTESIIDDTFTPILHSHGIFKRSEINYYDRVFRFGVFDPYTAVSTAREFLFFTKPDLNIDSQDEVGTPQGKLHEALSGIAYWEELYKYRKDTTIETLELSLSKNGDPFNHLLQNCVISNLDIPGLAAETIDTPINSFGVGYSYRGTSEGSNDNPEFSLEFKDTRWLDVFQWFHAYEEYETVKKHGLIAPADKYILNKVLHDAFAIFKFIVDEDMETILYWGKMIGVYPKSLPRDAFSNASFENGISFSIDFKAAFYDDMRPDILRDFNALSKEFYDEQPYQIGIYNGVFDTRDNRPARAAYVKKEESSISPTGWVYKLKWRGSEQY